MALPSLRLAAALVSCALLSCAAGHPKGAEQPSSPKESENQGSTPPEVRESARFGYSWTLPGDWEFIVVEGPEQNPGLSAIDIHAARRKDAEAPKAELVVSDLLSRPERTTPEDYEEFEKDGADLLERWGASVTGSKRVKMFGVDVIEVNGTVKDQAVSVRVFNLGGRRFELRCSALPSDAEWPCAPAFASLVIGDMKGGKPHDDPPRVLHLREARFHLEFDAPDDGLLSTGPRTALGGAQLVWFWRKDALGIDVQVLDLSTLSNVPDQSFFAEKYAEALRATGATVAIEESRLAGKPCAHLQASQPGGVQKDMFILHDNGINYSLLVTQKVRDKKLIEKVKEGFFITSQ